MAVTLTPRHFGSLEVLCVCVCVCVKVLHRKALSCGCFFFPLCVRPVHTHNRGKSIPAGWLVCAQSNVSPRYALAKQRLFNPNQADGGSWGVCCLTSSLSIVSWQRLNFRPPTDRVTGSSQTCPKVCQESVTSICLFKVFPPIIL